MPIVRFFILILILFITSCGTTDEESSEINPDRGFDMWDYMTSSLDYRVEYDIYENGNKVDYYIEENRLFDNGTTYERKSKDNRTLLYLNSSFILMKEPSEDVEIARYVKLGDNHIFNSTNIENCIVEHFYPKYKIYNSTFNNVLRVDCSNKNGMKKSIYYGYSEGIVAIYEDRDSEIKEYIKVDEKTIFEKNIEN